jgi:dienelactone hydrolase
MFRHALKVLAIMAAVVAIKAPLAAADGGPSLPAPTGEYSVGRATYYLLDMSRNDERGTQKDHKREFMAQVWYPAQSGSKGKPAAWLLPEWARLKGNDYSDLLAKSPDPAAKDVQKFLASVVVHAQEDVPVASLPKPFPVILLAPGSISFPSKYTSLAEDLASHGFIVVGDVPVGNGITVPFPAGNVTPGYKGAMFDEWAGDLVFEIDQLKVWNETRGHLFYGRVDLERIGAFGHSAGGLIVARIPHMDKRVKAIALLDPGSVEPEDGKAIPVLILKSEEAGLAGHPEVVKEKARTRDEYLRRAKPGIQMKILGAEHPSFTDLAVIPAFARPGDGKAFIDTTRAVLREFFGQYLLEKQSDLLVKGSARYPLLKIETHPLY